MRGLGEKLDYLFPACAFLSFVRSFFSFFLFLKWRLARANFALYARISSQSDPGILLFVD